MTRRLFVLTLVSLVGLVLAAPRLAAQDEKPLKAQSEVASREPLGKVSARDKSVTAALKASDLEGAAKLEGKESAFQGTVVKVYTPDHHKAVVLNFAKDYKTALTAAVRPDAYAKFPDLRTLDGKRVLVTGKIVRYREALEILLTDPKQLKVIE
jgi:hypothetical protein